MIVNARIIYDRAHAKCFARICAGCEFSPQPTQSSRLKFVIPVFMAFPIPANDLCKFKAASKFFKMAQTLTYDGARWHVFFLGVSVRLADKPLNHTGQSSTIGLCAR